jgi:hypothetical protein
MDRAEGLKSLYPGVAKAEDASDPRRRWYM